MRIFEKYIAKHPSQDPKCSKDLYLCPLAKITDPGVWYSCQAISVRTLGKVIAKLCHAGGLEGRYSNHSLCSTAATRLYDSKFDEQQIAEVTGHKLVAIRNYKHTSMEKQCEVSDVLYSKRAKPMASSTVTKAEFDLGMNSQAEATKPAETMTKTDGNVTVTPTVNINVNRIDVKKPVIMINQPQIMISPVINLHAQDLPQNALGDIQLPEIDVALTININ